MEKTLLDEFDKYELINNNELEITNLELLSPTITLLLLCNSNLEFDDINTIQKIEPKQNYRGFKDEILSELNIPNYNNNILNFIFHELINNIYDHSEFSKGFVMGKSYPNFKEISFIDNGITIPTSLRKNNHSFENDCRAIIEAINGLSTKNELGFAERGTGLNNTTNIVMNGCGGEILVGSGNGLIFLSKGNVFMKNIDNAFINGTLISLRIKLKEKVDIYNYLNPIKI